MPSPAPPVDRLVYTEKDLDDLHILSRKTRYRLRRAGKFPQTRAMGARRVYLASDIHEYLAKLPASDSTRVVRERDKRRLIDSVNRVLSRSSK